MRRILNLLIGFAIAALFLWLSLRNVAWGELTALIGTLSWGWTVPFFLTAWLSHFLRAYRWKLLLEAEEGVTTRSLTLFAGLMYGYVANIAVPRLGEVVRAVYVNRKTQIRMPTILGTVVVERLFDLLFLVLSLGVFAWLMLGERETLAAIVGEGGADRLSFLFSPWTWLTLFFSGIAAFLTVRHLWHRVAQVRFPDGTWKHRTWELAHLFASGITTIRRTGRPLAFWMSSLGIWTGYVAMSVFPFFAFPEALRPENMVQACWVVTVVGSLGIALPSPSGLGTYHYFVSQTLMVLYAFPASDAVAYALLNHTASLLVLLTGAPVLLVWNRYRKG